MIETFKIALCMTEFPEHNLSFQDNFPDTGMYPLPWFCKYVCKLIFRPAKF